MRFKTLKHKSLADTYGVIDNSAGGFEIMHSGIPDLQPMSATIELMKKYWNSVGLKTLIEELDDYDLIEVHVLESSEFNKVMGMIGDISNTIARQWSRVANHAGGKHGMQKEEV